MFVQYVDLSGHLTGSVTPRFALPVCISVRGGEWSFKNAGSRKILVEFHGSRSLVFLAVMCVSQSRFFSGYVRLAVSFFIRRCLGVSIFCKAKGLKVLIRLFVF